MHQIRANVLTNHRHMVKTSHGHGNGGRAMADGRIYAHDDHGRGRVHVNPDSKKKAKENPVFCLV